jgi:hypothetical protein
MGGNFTNYVVYNGSTLQELGTYMNTVTVGVFWFAMLWLSYAIIFISVSKTRPTKDAFAISSWLTGILSVFVWGIGWITEYMMIVFALLMLISLILLWTRGEYEM